MLPPSVASSFENRVPDAVAAVSPSVVVVTQRAGHAPGGSPSRRSVATGTGLIVHSGGYVVTNRHVVGKASQVEVAGAGGEAATGRVLGFDAVTDLAVVHAPELAGPAARLGDSHTLRAGEFVIAIGNSLGLPGAPTVSLGVVSATARPLPGTEFQLEGWIQTDAAVNPGNSGGPLATLNADVVGINTAMVPYAQGVGFAIPINTVKSVFQSLVDHGRVIRPWLGIIGATLTPELARRSRLSGVEGVVVADLQESSPAEAAGLRTGDVIVAVDGRAVRGMTELLRRLSEISVGHRVPVTVRRAEATLSLPIALQEARVLPTA
ncbi:MAG: trypsin-like peptidase domain-containing protein [Thermoplasmata archaeon]|nr:trypsin-like peptidase domain-containing protein [Thermoplasmata archaeon]